MNVNSKTIDRILCNITAELHAQLGDRKQCCSRHKAEIARIWAADCSNCMFQKCLIFQVNHIICIIIFI